MSQVRVKTYFSFTVKINSTTPEYLESEALCEKIGTYSLLPICIKGNLSSCIQLFPISSNHQKVTAANT